jgi:hypothetical protein
MCLLGAGSAKREGFRRWRDDAYGETTWRWLHVLSLAVTRASGGEIVAARGDCFEVDVVYRCMCCLHCVSALWFLA